MKLMIASDIHGSAYYCQKLVDCYRKEKPDKLLLLGDILYHGPRNDLPRDYDPKRVIKILNDISENIICVRGNCDAEVDQMVLDFEVLAEYAYVNIDGYNFFAAHGHNFSEQNPPKLKRGDVLLNGHTHVPDFKRHENYIYVNCGSVSLPKENSPHSYMIFEDGMFFWYDVDGHIFRTKAWWSEDFKTDLKIGFDELSERDLWEAENRDYLSKLKVEADGKNFLVNVYGINRLNQEFETELNSYDVYTADPNLVIVSECTKEKIEITLKEMYKNGYFKR